MINTPNLDLVEMSPAFLQASIAGLRADMESGLGAIPAAEWPEDRGVAGLWLQRTRGPEAVAWGPRAVILRSERLMIGHAGFHRPPGDPKLEGYAPGGVELGYTIYAAHRRRGFATEACLGLIDWASARGVTSFVVSISPSNTASLAVARRLGFMEKAGSRVDPDDGTEDVYVLRRPGQAP